MTTRTKPGRHLGALLAPAAVLLALATDPGPATAQGICEGFPNAERITRLGGPNAFAPKGVETLGELQALIDQYEPDIRWVFSAKDAERLATPMIQAIKSGEGVRERDLQSGEVLQWMAFRKGGAPRVSTGPRCVATAKSYSAFEVDVLTETMSADCTRVETTTHTFLIPKICINFALLGSKTDVVTREPIPPPICAVEASRSCDPSRSLSVDATGSSAGAEVSLNGRTIIAAGAPLNWSGADESPYEPAAFTVRGRNTDLCGRPQTCEDSVTVEPCVRPSCSLTTSTSESWARQPFTVQASGHWAMGAGGEQIHIEVRDADGNVVEEVNTPSAELRLRPGTYTIAGTATNELGDTADCNELQVVVKPRWTLRPLLALVNPDDDQAQSASTRADGTSERTKFLLGNGAGAGLGLEYRFSERVGFEGTLLFAQIDSAFTLDLNNEWERDTDDISWLSLTVGPNFHLTPNSRPDFYIGPFVGLVQLGEGTYTTLGERTRQDLGEEFGIGLQLGLDIPFGAVSQWGLHLGARYMDLSADANEGDLAVDPLIFTLGLAYDF